MKRILAKLPGGSTRLASYAAALFLIKEHKAFTEESLITEDIDEDDLEKSLSLFSEAYLNYTTLDDRVNGFLSEKLKKSDDMGTWIKDFYDSDAPQFKGKSKAKRRQMAVAAKLDAMDESTIHPEVAKAYKKTLDAEDKAADYNHRANKARVTRSNNHLNKMIKKHHPGLDMQGNIKLRTQLQNMKETLEEAAAPRWKRAGPNGEIQATVGGKKYQIEKSLDHNERHKGEWKVMVWDKRRNSWEWETTEYGKANAKAWIMDRLQEEPANNVGSGNIAGMDGGHMSKEAQKKWTSSNKSKKKKLRDIMGDKL